MIIVRLLSPSLFGWFGTTKVYSGLGADIVMESITFIENWPIRVNECYRDITPVEMIAYQLAARITSCLPTILDLSRSDLNLSARATASKALQSPGNCRPEPSGSKLYNSKLIDRGLGFDCGDLVP